jgi:hypothetical protein
MVNNNNNKMKKSKNKAQRNPNKRKKSITISILFLLKHSINSIKLAILHYFMEKENCLQLDFN